MPLLKKLDHFLLDLCWSLWTELGVAGVKRKHQDFLIYLEELVLLTAVLADIDPRLRNESLDWCSQYHRFLSISRLKSILKSFGDSLDKPFSIYSSTLNSISNAAWPIFVDSTPIKLSLSHKSCLRPLESPALLNIRVRSIFGTNARADLITFFLTHKKSDFAASDVTEIGYSKRNLAEILEDLCLSGLFDKYLVRNHQRYRLVKNEQLIKVLGPVPEYAPLWRLLLEVLLPIRDCITRIENYSESTKVVEIRNLLTTLQKKMQRLNLTPPSFQTDFHAYLNLFAKWLLEIVQKLAQGDYH
jgi:hypothetical protein